jgi:hypothetical protein
MTVSERPDDWYSKTEKWENIWIRHKLRNGDYDRARIILTDKFNRHFPCESVLAGDTAELTMRGDNIENDAWAESDFVMQQLRLRGDLVKVNFWMREEEGLERITWERDENSQSGWKIYYTDAQKRVFQENGAVKRIFRLIDQISQQHSS